MAKFTHKKGKKSFTRRKRIQRRRARKSVQRGGQEPCTAVMVEPREHPAVEFVVDNIVKNLPANWKVLILCITKNKEWMTNLIKNSAKMSDEEKGRIEVRVIKINGNDAELLDHNLYNTHMMTEEFLNEIPTETFLVFQTDSMICKKGKDLLEKFMKYDYVGAPYDHGSWYFGNGGFSLRKKSKMLQIIQACKKDGYENQYFSKGCDSAKPFMPSLEEMREFAIDKFGPVPERIFGMHQGWIQSISEDLCEGYGELKKLNGH
jgi:hypothetical protein